MVITMAIDLYGDKNNGTTVTAMRTCEGLVKLGHEVRVIAWMPDEIKDDVVNGVKVLRCKKKKVPVFDPIVSGNGFTFGGIEEKKIAEFIKGSDVVHIMFPFPLEAKIRRVAKVMGIATTAAYHLQPDSISYNLYMGHFSPFNNLLYWLLNHWLYRHIRTVHTPSRNMKELMIAHHYRSDIYAISNGVSSYFEPIKLEKTPDLQGKYVITMIGRLSGEKRQDLLIKAIGLSKYNDKIQLILCGQGPRKQEYELRAKHHLKNPVMIKFCRQHEIKEVLGMTDLYVHASDIESEGISCIEALACGVVPVISDSKNSATRYFALDERCLFRHGNAKSLAERIDYFIEHPEEKGTLSSKSAQFAKKFEITEKIQELVKMMELEITRHQEDMKLGRTYYSTRKERRHLRRTAKKAGIDNPVIFKKDLYHAKEKMEWEKNR